jgi:hypothetical protein
LNDIIRVKAGTALTDLFIRVKLIAGGSISLSLVSSTRVLCKSLSKIQQKQGTKGLVLFLKSSSVALQQACAGYVVKDFAEVGPRIARSGSGLPRIIPARHRLLIRNRGPGCYILIRFYLSIFYVYRVLVFPGTVKLNTVTDPGVNFDLGLFKPYILGFNRLMLRDRFALREPIAWMKQKVRLFPIFKASPFTSFTTAAELSGRINLKGLYSTHIISLIDAMRTLIFSSI